MKKLLGFLLAFGLTLSFAGCTQEETPDTGGSSPIPPVEENYSEGLTYLMKSNGSYCVTGVGVCTDAEIIIPATYQGAPVVEIAENAFALTDAIVSVEIPASVVAISPNAFYLCVGLESVVFKDTAGWIVKELDTVVTGTAVDLTNASQAATLLKDTYRTYFWRKS